MQPWQPVSPTSPVCLTAPSSSTQNGQSKRMHTNRHSPASYRLASEAALVFLDIFYMYELLVERSRELRSKFRLEGSKKDKFYIYGPTFADVTFQLFSLWHDVMGATDASEEFHYVSLTPYLPTRRAFSCHKRVDIATHHAHLTHTHSHPFTIHPRARTSPYRPQIRLCSGSTRSTSSYL